MSCCGNAFVKMLLLGSCHGQYTAKLTLASQSFLSHLIFKILLTCAGACFLPILTLLNLLNGLYTSGAMVQSADVARSYFEDAPNVEVVEMPINDGWTRDWGPSVSTKP